VGTPVRQHDTPLGAHPTPQVPFPKSTSGLGHHLGRELLHLLGGMGKHYQVTSNDKHRIHPSTVYESPTLPETRHWRRCVTSPMAFGRGRHFYPEHYIGATTITCRHPRSEGANELTRRTAQTNTTVRERLKQHLTLQPCVLSNQDIWLLIRHSQRGKNRTFLDTCIDAAPLCMRRLAPRHATSTHAANY
jgi:hypothetical protein